MDWTSNTTDSRSLGIHSGYNLDTFLLQDKRLLETLNATRFDVAIVDLIGKHWLSIFTYFVLFILLLNFKMFKCSYIKKSKSEKFFYTKIICIFFSKWMWFSFCPCFGASSCKFLGIRIPGRRGIVFLLFSKVGHG